MSVLANWLRNNFKQGDPTRIVADHLQANRIANILQDIQGLGCRIEKPTDADGRGWKIIIDGSSDITPPDGYEFPGGSRIDQFDVNFAVTAGYVTVRAGTVAKQQGNTEYHFGMTVDGGGSSEDPANFQTLGPISSNTYIFLAAGTTGPAIATLGTGAWPTLSNGITLPLAYVVCTGGFPTRIIQLKRGMWHAKLDYLDTWSLNYCAATGSHQELLQLNDYATATSSAFTATSLLPFHPGFDEGSGEPLELLYADHDSLVTWLSDSFAALVHPHVWNDLSDAEDLDDGSPGNVPAINSEGDGLIWVDIESQFDAWFEEQGGIDTTLYYLLDVDGVKHQATFVAGLLTAVAP